MLSGYYCCKGKDSDKQDSSDRGRAEVKKEEDGERKSYTRVMTLLENGK